MRRSTAARPVPGSTVGAPVLTAPIGRRGRNLSGMEGPVRMAPLTWVAGAFRAQVLAARLESEGIDAQLRGALASPYGLTMGDMARVDVYVPEDQLDDAKYVLLADEVDATLAAPTDWWDAGTDRPRAQR